MDEPPKILRILEKKAEGLKRSAFTVKQQPMSEFGTRYGGFQRRMIAATIDTLIMTFTLFPLSLYLTNGIVGEVSMDLSPLIQSLQYIDDPAARAEQIKLFFVDAERLEYFNVNTTIQLIGLFIYCAVCWKHFRATPGKMLVRLVVVDEKTGKPLGYIQSFWRFMGYMIGSAALCLGILWSGFDKRRQGWHDKLATSIVIVKPPKAATAKASDEQKIAEEQKTSEETDEG